MFPFSPRWLAMVDRSDEALTSLARLRRLPTNDDRVQIEYRGILAEVEFQNAVLEKNHPGVRGLKRELYSWLDLFSRKTWRRLAVGCGVCFFQQFSGINAFIYYAPTLFQSLGQDEEMSLILSGVFNILQLVAVVICFLIIDKVGRRPLAIWGAVGTTISYTIISILSGLYGDNWPSHGAAGWACVAMAFMFILTYGVSYSPLGWCLPPEVFPNAMRAKGVAMAVAVNWISNFVVGVVTPPMLEQIKYKTFVFFAVMCFITVIWAVLLVPETKGRSLEEMDQVFRDTYAQEEKKILKTALISHTGITSSNSAKEV
jgi:sugar porter (SP) family MFS transporter